MKPSLMPNEEMAEIMMQAKYHRKKCINVESKCILDDDRAWRLDEEPDWDWSTKSFRIITPEEKRYVENQAKYIKGTNLLPGDRIKLKHHPAGSDKTDIAILPYVNMHAIVIDISSHNILVEIDEGEKLGEQLTITYFYIHKPGYRHFANFYEFYPYKNKLVKDKDGIIQHFISFDTKNELLEYSNGLNGLTFKQAFEAFHFIISINEKWTDGDPIDEQFVYAPFGINEED